MQTELNDGRDEIRRNILNAGLRGQRKTGIRTERRVLRRDVGKKFECGRKSSHC